jgi:hypothetical protein
MSFPQPSSSQFLNDVNSSICESDVAIDLKLITSGHLLEETNFWEPYNGMNFLPDCGREAGDIWSLQNEFGEPCGSSIRYGQPTPLPSSPPHTSISHQTFPTDDSEESVAEEKSKAPKKRSRVSNSEGKGKLRKNSKVDIEDTSHLNIEELAQREHFLERNRIAASKCRHKKKEWTNKLNQRARELQAQREMLVAYVSILRNELIVLKCKCLEHSDCKCERVRDYLKNTVVTLPPASASLYRMGQIEDKLRAKQASPFSNEAAEPAMSDGMQASRSTSIGSGSPNFDFLN